METISSYFTKYKDTTFKELPWNDLDYLFCAILAYLPLKSFSEKKTFNELVNNINNGNLYEKNIHMEKTIFLLLNILTNSARYKNMVFYNFVNDVNDNTQFGALTIKVNNMKIISFKGSDKSIIGWLENFRLAYSYPTYTQELAINYLNNNIAFKDNNIHIVGHSKGGNLAMSSVMNLNKSKLRKIKQIVNFDGPGFKYTEYNSERFKNISNKIKTILPTGSYIGVLMFNDNYNVIKTSKRGIAEHYPINWLVDDYNFVNGQLSKVSNELHLRTTINTQDLDLDKFKIIFEAIFKTLDYKKTKDINITLTDIKTMFSNIKEIDKETSKYFYTIIKSMLKISTKK